MLGTKILKWEKIALLCTIHICRYDIRGAAGQHLGVSPHFSCVWIRGVILFELIVSDYLKLNERIYFRFSFGIYVKELCAVIGIQGTML